MTALLPNARQQFCDGNGQPLAAGSVYFYEVGTTTPKATYQDQALGTPNSNPVILDSAGRATIWGSGNYRQVLYDANSVLIWDGVTSG